jgi:hypothetical protein
MYVVVRRYENAVALHEAMQRGPQEIERLLSSVPGFVSYHGLRDGNTVVTVSVCQDRAGVDETTRRAAEWVREHVPAGAVGAPEIIEGESFLNFAAPQMVGAGGGMHR